MVREVSSYGPVTGPRHCGCVLFVCGSRAWSVCSPCVGLRSRPRMLLCFFGRGVGCRFLYLFWYDGQTDPLFNAGVGVRAWWRFGRWTRYTIFLSEAGWQCCGATLFA